MLASKGANVMINGLGTPAEIKDAQAKIAKHNVTVKYNGANLMNANEVEALVKDTVAQFGSVDILVNNAGPSCSIAAVANSSQASSTLHLLVQHSAIIIGACMPLTRCR